MATAGEVACADQTCVWVLCCLVSYTHLPILAAVGCILAELLGRKPLFPGARCVFVCIAAKHSIAA